MATPELETGIADPNEFSFGAPEEPIALNPIGGNTGTADATSFHFVPLDDKEVVKGSQRLGVGRDKKPIVNVQAVDPLLRLKTQLFFDKAEEKAKFLKQELGNGWDIDVNPLRPGDVILKRKGDSHWGVVDPGGFSGNELLQEVGENVDSLAQMAAVPASALTGALAAGGIEAGRQALKQILLPGADFSVGSIAANAAGGVLAGGLQQLGKAGTTASKNAASAIGDAVDTAAAKVESTGVLGRIGDVLNLANQPKFIAQEIGATGKQFNTFQKKAITENIAYLQQAYPEFNEALKQTSLQGKYEALHNLLKDTGAKLGDVYSKSDVTINVGDLLNSEKIKLLNGAIKDGEVIAGKSRVITDELARNQGAKIKRNFIEQLATLTLDDTSPYLKAYRAGKLHKLDLFKSLGVKNNDDAMLALISKEEIPIADAWALKQGAGQRVKYGKKKGQISSANTMQKYVEDGLDDSITAAIGANGGDDLAALNKIYNNLFPVVDTIASKVSAKSAELPNPIKILPGALNGMKRGGIMLARNLFNRTEVRSFLRGSIDTKFPLPEGMAIPQGSKMGAMRELLKGGSFLEGRQMARKQLLPRDTGAYFEDPEKINQLLGNVDQSDVTDAMVKQYERGDRKSFGNTLSQVASEHDDEFDLSPYKSLVTTDGVPTITDKYEREHYRDYLSKHVLDPTERYKAMQALNMRGEMIKPPFEPKANFILNSNKPKGPQGTVIQRVAGALKNIDKVDVGDDTERVDHDY